MQVTKSYEVLIFNLFLMKFVVIISSSSKQLKIMIKKHSLFFEVVLFGKLLCFSHKNRFYFGDNIFLRMKPGT